MIAVLEKKKTPEHIVNWQNQKVKMHLLSGKPLQWQTIFANTNPIDLEIGIGNGSFMVPFCRDHMERNMIGVEIEGFYLKKADRKLETNKLTNGKLLIGDAKLLVWKLIGEETLENVYINYPDPWFKKRRLKRRVINSQSLRMIATKMRGMLTIATDDEDYRDGVVESIRESGCFDAVFDSIWTSELPGYYETKYERKWKAMGKPVFYMKFRKTIHPKLDEIEFIETQNLDFALKKLRAEAEDSMIEN